MISFDFWGDIFYILINIFLFLLSLGMILLVLRIIKERKEE